MMTADLSKSKMSGFHITIDSRRVTYSLREAEKYQALCETIEKLNFRKAGKAIKTLTEKVRTIDERSPVEDIMAKKRFELKKSMKQADTKMSDVFK